MTDPCARALAFVILTAVRVGDLSGKKFKKPATSAEIEGDVWHVPKTRTKNKVDFDVPLTPTALSLIGKRGDAKAPLFAIDGSAYDKVEIGAWVGCGRPAKCPSKFTVFGRPFPIGAALRASIWKSPSFACSINTATPLCRPIGATCSLIVAGRGADGALGGLLHVGDLVTARLAPPQIRGLGQIKLVKSICPPVRRRVATRRFAFGQAQPASFGRGVC